MPRHPADRRDGRAVTKATGKGRGGKRAGAGRKSSLPAIQAAALAVAEDIPIAEAVERVPGAKPSTAAAAKARRAGATSGAAAGTPGRTPAPTSSRAIPVPANATQQSPAIAAGTPVERLRTYATHDGEALAVLDRLLAPRPEIVGNLGQAARDLLTTLEADYRAAMGTRARGAIAEKIVTTLRELRQHFPPPAPARARDEVLEELRRVDGEVLARIEQHATEPITSEEIH